MQAFWALTRGGWQRVCPVPITETSYSELGTHPLWLGAGVWVSGSSFMGSPFPPGMPGSCRSSRCCRSDVQPHIWSPPPFM